MLKCISHVILLVVVFILLLSTAHSESPKLDYELQEVIALPGATRWDYLTFDTAGNRLFITRGDSVDILDAKSKRVIRTLPKLEGVHGVSLARDLNKGFVTEGKGNRVTIFDLTNLKILATVPTGNKPDAIAYDEATHRAFAADGESDDFTAIDAKTSLVIGKIPLGGQPEFTVVDGKGRLYANLEDKAQIAVVDTRSLAVIAHYNLAPACESPTGLAIDKAHNRLFSVCKNKSMVIVDAANGKILDTLPTGSHSDAATFDDVTGLAFSSNGDGTLTVVGEDGSHYKVLQTVATKPTARTMALDPLTHNLYLAAAETDGIDPSTAQHLEPRPHVKSDTFMILVVSPKK